VWFAFGESILAFLAGLWTRWTSVRKVKKGQSTNDLYGCLTTAPNAEVKAITFEGHAGDSTTPEEVEVWLTAPTKEVSTLRSLPDGSLQIVARGDRTSDAADAGLWSRAGLRSYREAKDLNRAWQSDTDSEYDALDAV
jgi:putative SOS response-associated peptidase YedK